LAIRAGCPRWLKAKLAAPDCIFNIVLCDGEPVGILRFDRLPARDASEVSILIAAEQQGRGIGSAALLLGKRLLPQERIIAAINPANRASIRMFEAACYRAAAADEWILEPASSV
jgi:UDP-2,4-diacetamido-2,4,6-trideoxy-beta-L-altropyranose hydrolase